MPQELLGDLVRGGDNYNPSRSALVWRDQEWSYLTLDGQIDQVAAGFLRLGVQPGNRIAFYMHNLPHFVVAFYALQRLGAVVVPVNIYWKDRDLRYMLEKSRVSGVVTIAPFYERVAEVQPALPEIGWVVAISAGGQAPEGAIAWEELVSDSLSNPVTADVNPDNAALIAFTGGRTGPSRPVLLTHDNLLVNCLELQDLPRINLLGSPKTEPENPLATGSNHEIALLPLPLFNLFSLNIGLNLTFMLGGIAVLMERFDPAAALELIKQRGCTLIFGSPAIFSELVNAPRFADAQLGSLRYAFSFGGPLPARVSAVWQNKTACPLFNCYGLTEAAPLLSCQVADPQISEDEIGRGLPGVYFNLKGATGENLPVEQISELLVSGPNLMPGYFDPANPTQPIPAREEGWFATGDMAVLNSSGNFEIVDRQEDILLLTNGELIVPRDIEKVLLSHPGIWEASALPYTTQDGRERMIAFVVLNEQGKSLSEPQLAHYCEKRMRTIASPERIFIYRGEDLPRLPNGAVWRRALRLEIPNYL